MPKLRKQRRKKKYNTNINRKRLRNKLYSVGKIKCKEIANAWDQKQSIKNNLTEMGLAYDPNTILKIPNRREELRKQVKPDKWEEEIVSIEDAKPTRTHVAEQLEKDAKAPRERRMKLPNSQVEFITYMLDKHGHDYKAMARDRRNYYQLTWKQIRAKIKLFIGIPEQFGQYLTERNMLDRKLEKDKKLIAALTADDESD